MELENKFCQELSQNSISGREINIESKECLIQQQEIVVPKIKKMRE